MDALLAAEVQSSVGPKRLNSAHFPVVASVIHPRVCGELIPDGVYIGIVRVHGLELKSKAS